MADTHQALDSWYEIWFGPEDDRRHFKRVDEESMLDEVNQLRKMNAVDIEITKISVSREPISESELSWQ
jgi:hypothetical protein